MAAEQLGFGAEYIMKRIDAGVLPDLRRVNIANGKQARVVRIADYVGYEKPCVAKFCGGEHKGYTLDEALMLVDCYGVGYKTEAQFCEAVRPLIADARAALEPQS
jgi:hypothetical protein